MQNQKDFDESPNRWELQRLEWELQLLEALGRLMAVWDEVKALEALIELADDQIERGPD